MKNSESKTDTEKAMREVSAALFELRDAFVALSLSLQDWQFETDLDKRKETEETVRQLLQQITAGRGPSS